MPQQSTRPNPGANNKQWYELSPERYEEEVRLMACLYPGFDLHRTDGENVYWTGEARALKPDGTVLKSLPVKVECPPDYPRAFPRVYDTSGTLKPGVCPHLNKVSDDVFAFCYGTRLEGVNFEDAQRVTDAVNYSGIFLAKQWYYERYGYWPDGHAHGVWPFIEHEIKQGTIDPTGPCPCGLGSKSYRDCHLPYVRYELEVLGQALSEVSDKVKKVERNDKCPCQGGKKFKKCCMPKINHASSKAFVFLKYPRNYGLSDDDRDKLFRHILGNPNAKKSNGDKSAKQ